MTSQLALLPVLDRNGNFRVGALLGDHAVISENLDVILLGYAAGNQASKLGLVDFQLAPNFIGGAETSLFLLSTCLYIYLNPFVHPHGIAVHMGGFLFQLVLNALDPLSFLLPFLLLDP